MKKKSLKQFLARRVLATGIVAILVIGGVLFVVNRNGSDGQDGKLQVTASFYPLYDFATQVGGDKVRVTNLTPAGAEPHDYEPSAKALADARRAKVFVYNGGTFEPWIGSFLADYKNTAVKSSGGLELRAGEEHSHGEEANEKEEGHETEGEIKDPHFWLDPVLAQQIVRNIRDGFITADPKNRKLYESNAEAYIAKLAALDESFKTGLASCGHRTIITSHDAFSYAAARYNITVESIAGVSPEMEPSASRLAELSKHIREEGISYVFFESLVSPRLADTIAQETGAQTLVLDPIEGVTNEDQKQGKDYISIHKQNLANLRTALACQ